MQEFNFTLKGTNPMLMHADDVEASDKLSEWRKATENKNFSVPGDDRSPPWTWQTYLYTDPEGKNPNIVYPSANIMVALRTAGAQLIMKKQKTFKEITQSGLVIFSEFCEFRVNGKQIPMAAIESMKSETFSKQAAAVQGLGFKLFVKRALIGRSKHVRVRPRFEDWEILGRLTVVAEEITPEILEKLFTIAGKIGLGDWRPGCKTPGAFGMFEAKLSKATAKAA